jgi:membrane protease YdiL (CAAX protease family)
MSRDANAPGGDQEESGEPIEPIEPIEAVVVASPASGRLGAAAWPATAAGRSAAPRIWTLMPVLFASGVALLFASAVAFVLAQWLVTGGVTVAPEESAEVMQQIVRSRLGLVLTVVLPQIALILPPLAAAALSPLGFRRRLQLVRGHWPIWGWVAAAMATPLVGLVSSLAVGLFLSESEALKETAELFRHHGRSGFLLPLSLMIGGLPALCEEVLFRGYVQTCLTRRVGGAAGVVVASAVFALFHLDPVHIVAVFPIGLWMGWITLRSGSLLPAMLAHFLNNLLSVLQVVLDPSDQPEMLALPTLLVFLAILGSGLAGVTGTILVATRYPRPVALESVALEPVALEEERRTFPPRT